MITVVRPLAALLAGTALLLAGSGLLGTLPAVRGRIAWRCFGGLAFAFYPVCMAHLLDHLPPADTLSAASSLLLLNGLGSAIGPSPGLWRGPR